MEINKEEKKKRNIPLYIFFGMIIALMINLAYPSIFPSENTMQFTMYEGRIEISQMNLIASLEMIDLNKTKFNECIDLNVNASNSDFLTLIYECMDGEGVKYSYYAMNVTDINPSWVVSTCDKIEKGYWQCQDYDLVIS